MYALIITIHIIACLILIATILFQSGRGGGLSDLFGAGSTQTIFGTRASTFLTRATTIAAIVFLLTSITLTVFSSQRLKSLMAGVKEAKETETKEKVLPESTTPSPGVTDKTEEEQPSESEAESQ